MLANGVNGESTSKDLTEVLARAKIPTQSICMFNSRVFESLISDVKEAFARANEGLSNMEVLEGQEEVLVLNSASQKTSI